MIQEAEKIEKIDWPVVSQTYNKSNISKSSVEALKLLLKVCSEESGLAEKVIADTSDLKSIIEGKREELKVFNGWRNDVFGKKVISLLEGKLAFTLDKGQIKQIII